MESSLLITSGIVCANWEPAGLQLWAVWIFLALQHPPLHAPSADSALPLSLWAPPLKGSAEGADSSETNLQKLWLHDVREMATLWTSICRDWLTNGSGTLDLVYSLSRVARYQEHHPKPWTDLILTLWFPHSQKYVPWNTLKMFWTVLLELSFMAPFLQYMAVSWDNSGPQECAALFPSSKEHIKGGLSSTLQDIIRMLSVLRANFMQFYLLYLPPLHIPYSSLHSSAVCRS